MELAPVRSVESVGAVAVNVAYLSPRAVSLNQILTLS